jgi:hypothetical protein
MATGLAAGDDAGLERLCVVQAGVLVELHEVDVALAPEVLLLERGFRFIFLAPQTTYPTKSGL